MAGINRALTESRMLAKAHESSGKPCVFLSHISIDKASAKAIGDYITARGDIDIYLDVNDPYLQLAVLMNDAEGMTKFIEQGISNSTHIMCLVSASTVGSWWVPYELGFGKHAGRSLATLKLKGEVELPAFLGVGEIIRGTNSLNQYLSGVRQGLKKSMTAGTLTESLLPGYTPQHPLDAYLDWKP